jgi:hypothetical protein
MITSMLGVPGAGDAAVIVDSHSDLLLELVHREGEGGEVDPFGSHWLPLLAHQLAPAASGSSSRARTARSPMCT